MVITGTFAQLLALNLGRGMLVAYSFKGGGNIDKFTLYYHTPEIILKVSDNVSLANFLLNFPNAVEVDNIA